MFVWVLLKECAHFFSNARGGRLPCTFSIANKDDFSRYIMIIRQFLPKEFHRKLLAVKEFEYYKAVEFRTIIIYLAPLLFKQYLPVNFYEHLLLLHSCILFFIFYIL